MRLISMFKPELTVDDYPIDTRFHSDSEPSRPSRLKPIPWTATIINWPGMSGGGNTRLEALEDLRKSFDRFRATKKALPRPGTKVPIEFAAHERVGQHAQTVQVGFHFSD